MVINQTGLNNGITLTLSSLERSRYRYGLSISGIDSHGYSFINNRNIMLDHCGQINTSLPRVRNGQKK
jgi:hypothetical protein